MAISSRKIVGAWRRRRGESPVKTLLGVAYLLAAVGLILYCEDRHVAAPAYAFLAVSFAGFVGYAIYRARDIRRLSYLVLRPLGPGQVRLSNGAILTVTGATGVYREGKRQITFTIPPPAREGFPNPPIPAEQFSRWDPPYQDEQLPEVKRSWVAQATHIAILFLHAKAAPQHQPQP